MTFYTSSYPHLILFRSCWPIQVLHGLAVPPQHFLLCLPFSEHFFQIETAAVADEEWAHLTRRLVPNNVSDGGKVFTISSDGYTKQTT